MVRVPDRSAEGRPPRGRKWPTAVDLYSGSGSVTAALKSAHYRVVAAVDNNPVACRTFRANHPRVHLYEKDIHKVDPSAILTHDLSGCTLDLLVVCAPCQPFSSQNKQRGADGDARADLILQAARFAEALKPKAIFFENVAGLATPRFQRLLRKLAISLRRIGYNLGAPERVDAAQFGVPQRRVRCIMIATREQTSPVIDLERLRHQRCTVRQAISHLRKLSPGQVDPRDSLHRARLHSESALKRLARIPPNGGSRFSLPPELELECHRGFSGHPDVYGRMKWDDVAPTLTTGCTDVTRGRFAHPEADRAITLREAALLQSFPPEYRFEGNSSEIAGQIGNAVPFKMAKELMRGLRPLLA